MIFLFAVPMMFQGFGVYLVPLICGTRNIAFPRLCAFSYYLYVVGGLLLWAGLLLKTGADAGWFAYVPLSGPEFTPGKRSDFWAQMITFTEVSALGVAICIATTILRYRAPGMTLNRMPIILWEKLVISMAVIFAMPAVMVVSSMLLMDRTINTQFFNPSVGGDVLLYQHLFWFFGHPEVYIIFLPGTAIVSTLVPVDWQVHDTFFVVAHFHYVLIGGALFPMFGGLYFWIPKITGRMMNDFLGKLHFWLFFIGFNVTFFTMHFLGLRGMPRRVYT